MKRGDLTFVFLFSIWFAIGASLVPLSTPASALAQLHYGGWTVRGLGNAACDSWLQWRAEKDPTSLEAEGWVQGYFTALDEIALKSNPVRPPNYTYALGAGTDNEALFRREDAYCRRQPSDTIAAAASAVADEIKAGAARR